MPVWADGKDAVTYAEVAHVVATIIHDCTAGSRPLRRQIEELKGECVDQNASEQVVSNPLSSLPSLHNAAVRAVTQGCD